MRRPRSVVGALVAPVLLAAALAHGACSSFSEDQAAESDAGNGGPPDVATEAAACLPLRARCDGAGCDGELIADVNPSAWSVTFRSPEVIYGSGLSEAGARGLFAG
jgi:hypothetical protein